MTNPARAISERIFIVPGEFEWFCRWMACFGIFSRRQ
jgi:hypothetical protein